MVTKNAQTNIVHFIKQCLFRYCFVLMLSSCMIGVQDAGIYNSFIERFQFRPNNKPALPGNETIAWVGTKHEQQHRQQWSQSTVCRQVTVQSTDNYIISFSTVAPVLQGDTHTQPHTIIHTL